MGINFRAIFPFTGLLIALLSCASPSAEKKDDIILSTGDGLVMKLDGRGQVTGLAADSSELLAPVRTGGFLLREYKCDPGSELIAGGDFESTGAAGLSGTCSVDTQVAYSGKASVCLDAAGGGRLMLDRIPLEPESVYMISFWMKADKLRGTPTIHIRRLDSGNAIIGSQANIEYLGPYKSGWTEFRHTFQTLPGTESGELEFHVVRDPEANSASLGGKIWVDNFSLRELRLPEFEVINGEMQKVETNAARMLGEYKGIRLSAEVSGHDDHFKISGTLQDTTGQDRCVQLLYRLPVAAVGWRWETGLSSGETIEEGQSYTNATEIGRWTNRYIAPWPYSSIDGSKAGLSLGVAVDHPAVYRMSYADGYYTLCFDFGLSPLTKKFPGQAEFSFVLSHHDPRWGMRAAAKKYFDLYPEYFEARTKPGATSSTRDMAKFKGLADFGAMYGDRHGGEFSWIKSANDQGMYSMTYNEPWMWRSSLGKAPDIDTLALSSIVARERSDIDKWDGNDFTGDYSQVPRAYSVRAFLNSAMYDENGDPISNGIRTYRSGTYLEWLTNSDPDITGTYGDPNRGLLSWKYEFLRDRDGAAKLGGTANGIRYDSVTEWVHMGVENFRKEHFAFADYPLTFSYLAARPCQLGYFCALEYMTFVRRQMLESGGLTYANGAIDVPWFSWLMDGISREGWNPDVESQQSIRMLMYHKTCGDWSGARLARYSEEVLKDHFNVCFLYSWWPGVDGRTQEDFDSKREFYRKHLPVLKALATSGWEPVTFATAGTDGILIERFGGENGRPLYFSVRNPANVERNVAVKIDKKSLGLAHLGSLTDALTGKTIQVGDPAADGTVSCSLVIPAGTTAVLNFAP